MSSLSARDLLRRAIAAARQGDRSQARMFLAKATEHDPEFPHAWLWRAGLADSAEQALVWLNRALDLDPQLPPARRALPKVRLQAAIAIAWAGDYATARHLLYQAAEADPDSIVPWLELAGLARHPDEARENLEEVLRRVPDHVAARLCLERLDAESRAIADTPTPPSVDVTSSMPLAETEAAPVDDTLIPVEFDLPPEFADASGSFASPPRRDPLATVMVVDASAHVRRLVRQSLEPIGIRVVEAETAGEALDQLQDSEAPDLVLVDGSTAGAECDALCDRLRQNPETAKLPLVLLAGRNILSSSFKAMMAGFNDSLAKPISPSSLRSIVAKYCPVAHAADEDTESWPELPEEILR